MRSRDARIETRRDERPTASGHNCGVSIRPRAGARATRRTRPALGEIAREDLALDLEVADPETGEITRTIPGRKTELILHISATDLTVGGFANTRTPISVEQIKTWLNLPGTSVIVRPVIDLNGNQAVDSYEIPDRIRRQVELRDHHCGYPYCHRPVESCDLDHIEPYTDDGRSGQTSTRNLCPECRGHHRMKTANRASYRMLHPGTYHWTLPSGTYLVDPTGTYQLTATPVPDE